MSLVPSGGERGMKRRRVRVRGTVKNQVTKCSLTWGKGDVLFIDKVCCGRASADQ